MTIFTFQHILHLSAYGQLMSTTHWVARLAWLVEWNDDCLCSVRDSVRVVSRDSCLAKADIGSSMSVKRALKVKAMSCDGNLAPDRLTQVAERRVRAIELAYWYLRMYVSCRESRVCDDSPDDTL